MLCKRLIPCLDVKDGRVVKGVRFVELRDAGDPVAAALAYDAQGADELVFLDITASHEDRATMLDVVRRTAEGIYMPLTVGGGHPLARRHPHAAARRRRQGVAQHRGAGAARARLGGRAGLRQPVHRGGDRRQARGRPAAGLGVYTHGGRRAAGRDAVEWAREVETLGAGEILLTSMDRDGTGAGYDLALTRAVSEAVSVPGHRLGWCRRASSISSRG